MGRVTTSRVLVLLLLVCFAGLQTASAVTVHSHDHGTAWHSCVICHAGHMPALQSAVAPNATPAAITEWRLRHENTPAATDPLPSLNFSRAPPA